MKKNKKTQVSSGTFWRNQVPHGHEKESAANVYCLLNILSFLFHSIQDLLNEDYKTARRSFGRRDAFLGALRYEICRYLHESWVHFWLSIAGDEPDS
jgi:hypothetical protein